MNRFAVGGLRRARRGTVGSRGSRRAWSLAVLALIVTGCGAGDASGQGGSADPVLRTVGDVPLPGPPVRFDYQDVDTVNDRLYVAHMNAGTLLAFDIPDREVLADVAGLPFAHGVIAVPELGKVYVTATGDRQVAVLDDESLAVTARLGPIGYPDGLAYAPSSGRVFVSDESSEGRELVIDGRGNRVVGRIDLGGEAGNTVFDPGSGRILVAVQTRDEVVEIDPESNRIVERHALEGADLPHGLEVDPGARLLFVANEGNAKLLVVDLETWTVLESHEVGRGPDVLDLDPGADLLYVAAESGTVSVFRERGRGLIREGDLHIESAHSVAVDPTTHLVYLPLEDVDGKPVLRIMEPRAP